jgi:hypothetical protein
VFSPYVTEGIGFFRNFITYSAQAHLREVSWMHDPSLALGILDNLGKVQREDGSFPGHNYSARPARDFYHADFATGARQLLKLHSVNLTTARAEVLEAYGRYFLRERWTPWLVSDGDFGMFMIFDQNETGQEYMSRYQFATENADQWASFAVAGVDATAYMIQLFLFLFEQTGKEQWKDWEERTREGLRMMAWDGGFFRDSVSFGNDRSPEMPATGFYPYLLQPIPLKTFEMQQSLETTLLDEGQFWLPKGFPATTMSDITFSADGEWKEKRLNCPWNGRSWPMVNSHLVDALANAARNSGSERLRLKAGEALMKMTQLMFHEGDSARPNSYEHYDPITGVPALYRGYDDYMHSWIVDQILRHAVGVQPGLDEVDPLPLGVDWIECSGIPHPRGRMKVVVRRGEPPQVEIVPA